MTRKANPITQSRKNRRYCQSWKIANIAIRSSQKPVSRITVLITRKKVTLRSVRNHVTGFVLNRGILKSLEKDRRKTGLLFVNSAGQLLYPGVSGPYNRHRAGS